MFALELALDLVSLVKQKEPKEGKLGVGLCHRFTHSGWW